MGNAARSWDTLVVFLSEDSVLRRAV